MPTCDTQGALFERVEPNLEGCCKPGWFFPGSVLPCHNTVLHMHMHIRRMHSLCIAFLLLGREGLPKAEQICSCVHCAGQHTESHHSCLECHSREGFPSSRKTVNHPSFVRPTVGLIETQVLGLLADCCKSQRVYISAWFEHMFAWLETGGLGYSRIGHAAW